MSLKSVRDGKTLSYGRQSISDMDVEAVAKALRSDWLTQGPVVREFEETLADYCGAKHCVATANGTAALHAATLALEIGTGDVGLTSPNTFMASANCILYCGGRPAFADIDPETLCLSPEEVEQYCRKKGPPKVVIAVDFAGVPAELPRFHKIAEKYGFKVIEDAAHAIGSIYAFEEKTYKCGSCAHSDLSILSFHPVKNMTTGEGGAVLTNDDALAEKVRLFSNHGIERNPERFFLHSEGTGGKEDFFFGPWYHEMQVLGYNFRITDIQCALGLSQLSRLEEFKARRQELVRQYNRELKGLSEEGLILLPPWPKDRDPCFHLYILRFTEGAERRKKIYMGLRDRNVYCQVHYIPVHQQPYYRKTFGYRRGDFPYAESYYEMTLSLPLSPAMTNDDVDFVVQALQELIRN